MVEISYSGGKDSDVILRLAQMAGIKHRAIYRRTTIDPPSTLQHVNENKAVIINPKNTFFELIKMNGFPNRFARFCCRILKEYKVLDTAVQGVRTSESTSRAKRYKEPVVCRLYGSKKEKVEVFYPILDWTDNDVKEFVEQEGVQCHKLYYDKNGCFDPNNRLGCICCPLKSTNKLREDFANHPGFVKAYIRLGKEWLESHKESSTYKKFGNTYNLFLNNVFCNTYDEYQRKYANSVFGESAKQLLEDYFKIDLP